MVVLTGRSKGSGNRIMGTEKLRVFVKCTLSYFIPEFSLKSISQMSRKKDDQSRNKNKLVITRTPHIAGHRTPYFENNKKNVIYVGKFIKIAFFWEIRVHLNIIINCHSTELTPILSTKIFAFYCIFMLKFFKKSTFLDF